MKLTDLNLFLQIVEKGSLVAAGRELALAPATVSERLAALEKFYGITLLNRTTRALSLTEEGRTLVDGARRILDEANDLNNKIKLGAQALSGSIKISATIDLGRRLIRPIVDEFITEHPNVSIELLLSDRYINIVDEGVDIAIRFGNLSDSTLRSKTLGKNQRIVCASPQYVERYGKPQTPSDLAKHNCLLIRFGPHLDNQWHFRINGKDVHMPVTGNRIANDGGMVHDWCLAGYGIALKSIWDVKPHIESGKLIPLLESYAPPPSLIQALFQPTRAQTNRVKAFANKLSTFFKARSISNT